MSDLKDFVGGLLKHPIDTMSGKLKPPSDYNAPGESTPSVKPAYTSQPAVQHLAPPPAKSTSLASIATPKAVTTLTNHPADAGTIADQMSK